MDKITLDDLLDGPLKRDITTNPNIGLKIDTQGYEGEVLAGIVKWNDRVKVIHTEMSLTPLYEGGIGFGDLFRMLEKRGYRCCLSIEPGFTDPKTYEMLQVDATFERLA